MTKFVKKKLGIIGGVGSAATACLFSKIIDFTEAKNDQDHLDIVVLNNPNIPDRTAYLTGLTNTSFVPVMQELARKLEEQNCEIIALPCNTAHAKYDEIAKVIDNARIIHMPKEVAKCAREIKLKKCGILATDGTLFSRVYQDALAREGVESSTPSKSSQKLVMSLIYDYVKAGEIPPALLLEPLHSEFRAANCDGVVLACTELSLLRGVSDIFLNMRVLDALDILAKVSVRLCGARLKHQ